MESMKYLAGILAGRAAKKDGNPKLAIWRPSHPEELRLGNAFMLGAKKTCPECTMDVRWINTWHDPVAEKDALLLCSMPGRASRPDRRGHAV